MTIGGLQKFSLLDYPDHVAAIIFTQGCNFRCQFCYNPMLVMPFEAGKFVDNSSPKNEENKKGHSLISENDLFYFLESRRGKLDALVITGGEPTLHADLPEFLKKLKDMDFKIKLDTNGTSPEMLKKLLKEKLVDYIAMDVKAPAEKYEMVAGVKPDLKKIKESIKIIMNSGQPYEFRTTIIPNLHRPGDIDGIGVLIKDAGKWFLQFFKSDTALVNKSFEGLNPYTTKEMEIMRSRGENFVKKCYIR
jgi:pyruvate formate lyase activating enzyme